MSRVYTCRIGVNDKLSVGLKFDDDQQLPVQTYVDGPDDDLARSGPTVWLNREQVENLWEMLGSMLGKTVGQPALWRDEE